ncbi:MAG: DinB family protein [Hyphomicrobiales bacterium]
MADRRVQLIRELERGLQESIAFFKELGPAELNVRVYEDGAQWTVREVLAHFITIERSMHWLFKDILSGGRGSPPDFDVERFNRTQPAKLKGIGLDELIEAFRAVRADTVEIVRTMKEEDLDREAEHAFHGHGRLERFIRWAPEHARLHQVDLQKALGR